MRLRRWGSREGLEAVWRSSGLSAVAELARMRRLVPGKKEKSDEVKKAAQGTKCAGDGLGSKMG